jgi:predicted DNA-binding transcriptional regulator AlpA
MQQTYLTAPGVRTRYGITKQTIWRWLKNEALGFPRPSRINNRLYWKLVELEAWEMTRTEGGADERAA